VTLTFDLEMGGTRSIHQDESPCSFNVIGLLRVEDDQNIELLALIVGNL
jgi:hypothetical protein